MTVDLRRVGGVERLELVRSASVAQTIRSAPAMISPSRSMRRSVSCSSNAARFLTLAKRVEHRNVWHAPGFLEADRR